MKASKPGRMRVERAVSAGGVVVREAVIAALGQIGGSEAKLLLRPLLRDASPSVQEAAAAAVAEADFGQDPLSVEYEL